MSENFKGFEVKHGEVAKQAEAIEGETHHTKVGDFSLKERENIEVLLNHLNASWDWLSRDDMKRTPENIQELGMVLKEFANSDLKFIEAKSKFGKRVEELINDYEF